MDDRSKIRQFLLTNFYVPDPALLGDEASLLDHGIVDSTGVLEVVAFLEDTFGIKVADTEMVPDNLDSVARIAAYVEGKKAA
jgi:acyl carrier protein